MRQKLIDGGLSPCLSCQESSTQDPFIESPSSTAKTNARSSNNESSIETLRGKSELTRLEASMASWVDLVDLKKKREAKLSLASTWLFPSPFWSSTRSKRMSGY